MNWQEIKASLTAFFQTFAMPFLQQNEPELKPIPIQVRSGQVDPRRPDYRRY